MKRIQLLLLLALVLALLGGCGGSKAPAPAAATPAQQKLAATVEVEQASPTEPADATEEPTATEEPAPTEEPSPTDEPVVEATSTDQGSESADLEISDEEASLKNLKSYKVAWSFEWTGKKDGKDQTVKWTSSEAHTSEPKATHTKFETSDSLEPTQAGSMEIYQIGDKSYMVSQDDGKTQCTAFSSDDNSPSSSMISRDAFGSISNGTLVGQETMNGVRTKHYKYDEKATGVGYFSKLTGDVWIADDGGYVVKDRADWEGNLFGMLTGASEAEVGKGSWTREVTDINQPFEITPPEGCDNPAEALPMMPDASEKMSFGAMTSYKTASKLADVAKFYQDEMPKAGWAAEGEGMTSDEFASLSFTKDGKKANVIITKDDEKTNVMISTE